MLFWESKSTDPYENLAWEEHVLRDLDPTEEYFWLWRNANAVIIGRNQNTLEEIDQAFVDAHQIRVARRLSGGGAVYHDLGNLNYTIVTDRDRYPDFSFRLFSLPVLEALRRFGVEASFGGRNDLLIGGRKVSGSSAYGRGKRVLHHGCILLDSNLDMLQGALRVPEAKIASKGIRSVRSRVTTVNAHAPAPVAMEELRETVKSLVLRGRDGQRRAVTCRDREAVALLVREKYGTWEWNYGRSPSCTLRREYRFPAGLLSVSMNVERGRIRTILLRGDFFSSREVEELEAALQGMPLDEKLTERLSALPVGEYIHGMTAAELAAALR